MTACGAEVVIDGAVVQVVDGTPTTSVTTDGPDALVLVVNVPTLVTSSDLEVVTVEVATSGGDPAPARYPLLTFDTATASPATVTTVLGSDLILSAEVEVLEAFDDAAATASLGTAAAPGLVLDVTEIDLADGGAIYQTEINQEAAGALLLFLNPATSTTGRGRVVVHIRRSV